MLKISLTESELGERIKWLIKLRWIFIIFALLTIWIVSYQLKIINNPFPLYIIIAALILINTSFRYLSRKIYTDLENLKDDEQAIKRIGKSENRFLNFQISLDISSLAFLIYFSGGITNPFIFYFIFHMIISSIILSRFAAYFQASTAAVFLFAIMTLQYYNKLTPNYILDFIPGGSFEKNIYFFGIFFVFTTTLFLSVFMGTSIVKKLREKENELSILKDSLQKQAEELKDVNKKLKESDIRRSEYVMKATHELRSPLAAVKNCLKVITSGYVKPESEKCMELLHRAQDRTDNLLYMINDLLSLSSLKSEVSIHPPEVLKIEEIIKKVISIFSAQTEEKNISVNYETGKNLHPLIGDKENLEILFINLVSNAIKYTPDEGTIEIKAENKNRGIRIIVSDTGIGISEDNISRIFEDFYRTKEAKNVDKRGTGLGLSIVKQIIKQHNGEIKVFSKSGMGTIFNILLKNIEK